MNEGLQKPLGLEKAPNKDPALCNYKSGAPGILDAEHPRGAPSFEAL